MRIAIETTDWVAVAFRVYVAELIQEAALVRHRPIATLGPDLLGNAFDADEALRRMRARATEPAAEVLLDQRVFAGVGNVYKSEVLFLAGIHPDAPIATISDDSLQDVIAIARRLLRENVVEKPGPGMVTYRGFRRTTGRMRPADRLWVYSRGGMPCRKCGARIASQKKGDDARVTYWCPSCQKMPS